MSVSEQEKSLRRRLLFNSLPEGTSAKLVQQAIDLLDNEFGEEPRILYGALVKRLKESLDESVNLGGVLGRIMVLRYKPEEEIGPEPPTSNGGSGAASASPGQHFNVTKLDPAHKVFNALFHGVVSTVQQRGSEDVTALTSHLTSQLRAMSLAGATQMSLQNWIANPSRQPNVVGSTGDLHKIINACFVWLCGKFGPVDADKVLLRAVQAAEQLPESFEHSPRKFL